MPDVSYAQSCDGFPSIVKGLLYSNALNKGFPFIGRGFLVWQGISFYRKGVLSMVRDFLS